MKILEFQSEFPNEESCKQKFREFREREGVTCKKCKNRTHYWHKTRDQFQCKKCSFRTTLRSGTVMQASKLPYLYWFVAMHLLTTTKKSFSAKELQRQLGHKRYEPIWMMLHKIRSVMGLRDDKYDLEGEMEIDEGFFETVDRNRNKEEPLKRGRGSQKQTTVLVMAESEPIPESEQKKNQKVKRVNHIKMKVINKVCWADIKPRITDHVDSKASVITDGCSSYNSLGKVVLKHDGKIIPKSEVSKILPWVHIAISNAKRLLLDIHHRIDDDFLQNYLNEYCFKFNRRYFGDSLFDRLLVASVSNRWNYLGEVSG